MARANREEQPGNPISGAQSAQSRTACEGDDLAAGRDDFWMEFALAEARAAGRAGEVPIGAVVVYRESIIGWGHNSPIVLRDPTAHAEILALRRACERSGNYRLSGATLYATVEPCAMCAGALVHARIARLVYGAADARSGGVDSVFAICHSSSLNHQVDVTSGVRADESRALVQDFFRARRKPAEDNLEGHPEADPEAGRE